MTEHNPIQSAQVQQNILPDTEIDFSNLLADIWDSKWIMLIIFSIFFSASIAIALVLKNKYQSTVILTPASKSSSSTLSKLAGQFGGLASLAGVTLDANVQDKSIIALEIIKTWGFIEKFIIDNNIQIEVFAANGWDLMENRLIIDTEIYDTESKQWVRDFNPNKGEMAEPNSWELYEKFIEYISINQDSNTGLITISVEYYSPYLAEQWTTMLVEAINSYIQEQDKIEALNSIQYLTEKITNTDVTEMQKVFYQLIEEQTQTLMLAEISDEYVLKTISPAKASFEPSQPNRVFIAIIGAFLGTIFALLIAVVRSIYKN